MGVGIPFTRHIFAVTEKGEGDMENEVKTVTISVDEYFDLRMRAETNFFLSNELSELKGRFSEVERRLWELEQKVVK